MTELLIELHSTGLTHPSQVSFHDWHQFVVSVRQPSDQQWGLQYIYTKCTKCRVYSEAAAFKERCTLYCSCLC